MRIHQPVLLKESIDSLNINPDGFYIDCTLGDGGHSIEILKKLSPKGLLVSIDQDIHALEFVQTYWKEYLRKENWKLINSNFSKLDKLNFDRKPDGVLMDLGISSRQLEQSHNRGFSYQQDSEPLDMRMDENLGVKAIDLLKVLNEKELAKIFFQYGEEKHSKLIAKRIKEHINDINTVGDLTSLIYKAVPAVHTSNKNPSRRVFQALRIVVNDELGSLEEGLDKAFELLNKDGRLVVITFHSLEDRIVKQFFKEKVTREEGILLYKEAIAPTDKEIEQNPRSSSSKLRTLIKI